jgi:hypothetical protein
MEILNEIRLYRSGLKSQDSLSKKDQQAAALESTPQGSQEQSFGKLNNSFAALQTVLQETDMPPTTQTIAAVSEAQKQLNELLKKWNELKSKQ